MADLNDVWDGLIDLPDSPIPVDVPFLVRFRTMICSDLSKDELQFLITLLQKEIEKEF